MWQLSSKRVVRENYHRHFLWKYPSFPPLPLRVFSVGGSAIPSVKIRSQSPTSFSHLSSSFRPNNHVFYLDRLSDDALDDKLVKGATVPGGEQVEPSNADSSTQGFSSFARLPSHYRGGEPTEYHFIENNPNHGTRLGGSEVSKHIAQKYLGHTPAPAQRHDWEQVGAEAWDAVVVGGGHNGLTCAAYLARGGLKVLVLERRPMVGGAAVSEELYPGFVFSRASYLAGLLRPRIIEELQLDRYGFKYLDRDPSSFTPSPPSDSKLDGRSLILGSDGAGNRESIAQFSPRDAEAFGRYEAFLEQARELVEPLLDDPLPNPMAAGITWRERWSAAMVLVRLGRLAVRHRKALVPLYELFTGPAGPILDRWFESDLLKATLATDAVIGAMVSPSQAGSAYVLLHHVMGEANGRKGVWAYVEGGMGRISEALRASAESHGARVLCDSPVQKVTWAVEGGAPRVDGVELPDGTTVKAPIVVSGCSPYHTFLELMGGLSAPEELPGDAREMAAHLKFQDFSCGAFKINCAVNRLPNFTCLPNETETTPNGQVRDKVGPQHCGTIHFEASMGDIENAYREASAGIPATRPVIEMTIPSALDTTIAPTDKGHHVVQLFVQFAPFDVDPKLGHWKDENFKQEFVNRVFAVVEEYAPGFTESVLYQDALSPLDLERVFGLHRGNIFHGSLSLHQLGFARPMAGFSNHRSPVKGLFLGSAGTHPGGGVMGAPGRNCAKTILADLGRNI